MASAKFNYLVIAEKVATSETGIKRVQTAIDKKFDVAKEKFIKEFENHPVTKEIEAGPEAKNTSGTLGGYGNLFSFLGFDLGENPIEEIIPLLHSGLQLIRTEKIPSVTGKQPKIKLRYSLRVPRAELEAVTKLRWETGTSWLFSIEKGISGLSNYISSLMNSLSSRKNRPSTFPSPPSHSTTGLQVKNQLRSATFEKVPYIFALLRDFSKYF